MGALGRPSEQAVKTLEECVVQSAPHIPAVLPRSLSKGGYPARQEPAVLLGEDGDGENTLGHRPGGSRLRSERTGTLHDGGRTKPGGELRDDAGRAAVIVTSNLPLAEWTAKIPNTRLCKAKLDRLTDQANMIDSGKDSYRFK